MKQQTRTTTTNKRPSNAIQPGNARVNLSGNVSLCDDDLRAIGAGVAVGVSWSKSACAIYLYGDPNMTLQHAKIHGAGGKRCRVVPLIRFLRKIGVHPIDILPRFTVAVDRKKRIIKLGFIRRG